MSVDPVTEPRTNEAWTKRQREVLDLLAAGKTNPEIADVLGVSLDGAKWHVREIMGKLSVASREEAAAYWRHERGALRRLQRRPTLPRWGWALGITGTTVAVVGGAAMLVAAAMANGASDAPAAAIPPVSPAPSQTVAAGYQVVPGDTCAAIASAHGITVEALRAENLAIDANCTNVQVGQVLALPPGVAPRVVPTSAPGTTPGSLSNRCNGPSLGASAFAPLHLPDGSLVFAVTGPAVAQANPAGCDGLPITVGVESKEGGTLSITGNPTAVVAAGAASQRWIPAVRWSNWCGEPVAALLVVRESGGSGSSGSGGVAFPSCQDPDSPSLIEAVEPPRLTSIQACDSTKLMVHAVATAVPLGTAVSVAVISTESAACLVDTTATFTAGGSDGWLMDTVLRGIPQRVPLGFVVTLNGRCGEGDIPSRVTVAGRTFDTGPIPLPARACVPGQTSLVPYSW